MKKKKEIIQFLKFGLVGICNTLVTFFVYFVSYYVLDASVHIGNFLGFVFGVLTAFILQNKYVFIKQKDEKRVWWKVLIKTYMAYAFTGLVLTEILLVMWLDIINLELYLNGISMEIAEYGINISAKDLAVTIAPFLNMFVTVPANYYINKVWAYRHKETK